MKLFSRSSISMCNIMYSQNPTRAIRCIFVISFTVPTVHECFSKQNIARLSIITLLTLCVYSAASVAGACAFDCRSTHERTGAQHAERNGKVRVVLARRILLDLAYLATFRRRFATWSYIFLIFDLQFSFCFLLYFVVSYSLDAKSARRSCSS